mmetsp:Transcript_25141/g.22177  ORF Transcript_25141/g.22177 Transcript_25141/m.22177 type:complete len:126 (-) Transcript_25141:404-781(-)
MARAWAYSATIIVGYIRWFFYLRVFDSTRFFARVLIEVLYDIRNFVVMVALLIVAFAVCFNEFDDTGDFKYQDHLLGVYNLMFDQLDYMTLDDPKKIFMSLVLFALNIVMINFLIAIMKDSYEKV